MRCLLLLLLIFCKIATFGQTESEVFRNKELNNTALSSGELKGMFIHNSFQKLFTKSDNSMVYGFIGDNYQRLRIKIISMTQSGVANSYTVYGKSMVNGNICEFHGAISIKNIRKYKVTSSGVDDGYKNAGLRGQFIIIGDYTFEENQKQKYSGVFKGVFATEFYLDKNGNVRYDDIDLNADGFTNNQFVGTWTGYSNKTIKRANWGDFRIPNSGDLDIGAGDFSPSDKYVKYGWQNLRDMTSQKSPGYKKAKEIEEVKWWL